MYLTAEPATGPVRISFIKGRLLCLNIKRVLLSNFNFTKNVNVIPQKMTPRDPEKTPWWWSDHTEKWQYLQLGKRDLSHS